VDTFRGWLWTIARNKLRDHFRDVAARPNAIGGSNVRELMHQNPARGTQSPAIDHDPAADGHHDRPKLH
jgi:DNA-directed RNA polymerase specialized sigma24 family protein